jgi:hypothetical protein
MLQPESLFQKQNHYRNYQIWSQRGNGRDPRSNEIALPPKTVSYIHADILNELMSKNMELDALAVGPRIYEWGPTMKLFHLSALNFQAICISIFYRLNSIRAVLHLQVVVCFIEPLLANQYFCSSSIPIFEVKKCWFNYMNFLLHFVLISCKLSGEKTKCADTHDWKHRSH